MKFKKIIALSIIALIVIAFFWPQSAKKAGTAPLVTQVDDAAKAEPKSDPSGETATTLNVEDGKPKDAAVAAVSNHETFLFQDPVFPQPKLIIPVDYFQPRVTEYVKKMLELKVFSQALYELKGHGYVAFNIQEITAIYPEFTETLLMRFASLYRPEYFWREFAGDARIKFKSPELISAISADLKLLSLPEGLAVIQGEDLFQIDLNQSGYKITLEQSAKFNQFFQKHQDAFNKAEISAEGKLMVMITSLIGFNGNLNIIVNDLSRKTILDKFLTGLEMKGLLLLDWEQLTLFQPEFGELLDLTKLQANGMLLKEFNGDYSYDFDFQKIKKNQEKILEVQEELKDKELIKSDFYQSFLDLPLEIEGPNLLKFAKSIIQIKSSFLEQKLFTPGTEVRSEFTMNLDDLGDRLEPTFLDVLKRLGMDEYVKASVDSISGPGDLYLQINLEDEQVNNITEFTNIFSYFIAGQNPKPTFKLFLELPATITEHSVYNDSKYSILEREVFNQKIRINLNLNEFKKILLFQDLARSLPQEDVTLRGYLEVRTDLIKTNRFLNQLINKMIVIKSLNLELLLRGLKGEGSIKLYPKTARFFDNDLMTIVYTLFKNNQPAYERWKLLKGFFQIKIKENFKDEFSEESLRAVYEYINKDQSPKAKELRVKNVIRQLGQSGGSQVAIPERLDKMLEILSDDRKISDVLKDKNEADF